MQASNLQNVTMAAIPKPERRHPSVEDIVQQGLKGIGGCCINLNWFAMLVFRGLGLRSFCIQGTHNQAPVAGTHCMVIVEVEDEKYLVEVGGAFPILEPVPMRAKNLPYEVLCAGGFPYEFRALEPAGTVGKFHIGGGLVSGKYV